jgi:N-acetylneuraminic acid mutarotase
MKLFDVCKLAAVWFIIGFAIFVCHPEIAWAVIPSQDYIVVPRTRTQLSQGRYDLAATTVGTKAMFAGGTQQGPGPYTNVDVYDLSTNKWTVEHLSVPRNSLAATTAGDIAIFAGGSPAYDLLRTLDAVDLYDYSNDTWTTGRLSRPRNQLAATSHGTKAYISGGMISPSSGATGPIFSDTIDVYDAVSKQWSVLTMPRARAAHSSVTIGDKILFAGGTRDGSAIVDIYNLVNGSWSTGQMSAARSEMAATVVGNKAIFMGGAQSSQYENEVDIYDAVTDQWSSDSLPHPTGHMAATTVGRFALFAGGVYTQYYNDVYVYDAATEKWLTTVPGLSFGRFDLAATSVGNLAIFAGGYGFDAVDMFRLPVEVPEPSAVVLLGAALIMLSSRWRAAASRRTVRQERTSATPSMVVRSAASADVSEV